MTRDPYQRRDRQFTRPHLPEALCARPGQDPEWWFDYAVDAASIEDTKAICRACPECAACLTWALEHDVRFGIWGATSPEERAGMRGGAA